MELAASDNVHIAIIAQHNLATTEIWREMAGWLPCPSCSSKEKDAGDDRGTHVCGSHDEVGSESNLSQGRKSR